MRNIAWLDANELAADQVNGQAITSRHQHLQVCLLAIERPLTILTYTAIDDGQIGLDAAIHINDALGDTQRMHSPAIGTRQNAHRVFHAQGHGRDNVRFEHWQVNEAGFLHEAGHSEAAQAPRACWSQFNPILLVPLRINTDNADAILGTELFDTQNSIGGLAIKFGTGDFTEYWLCATGPHLFSDRFEQCKTGGCSRLGRPTSHKIRLQYCNFRIFDDGGHAA